MTNISSRESLRQKTLAEIVTADIRTASVFDRLGLDYCCRGHQTLEEATGDDGNAVERVIADIEALGSASPRDRAAAEWPELDALTRHIVSQHHSYVRQVSPVVLGWLEKLVARHGARHPELRDVQATFTAVVDDLMTHMMKEEHILFPVIDAFAVAGRTGSRLPATPFGTILNPIRVMEAEHVAAGDQLGRLREITNNYTPPGDACTTYRLCYGELARYEADLHRHVHLENHVLFPRAVELEASLS
jgi:regulator of cell morphogenesis and NO signaling